MSERNTTRLSGAQYKKQRIEKQEKSNKLKGSLLKYLQSSSYQGVSSVLPCIASKKNAQGDLDVDVPKTKMCQEGKFVDYEIKTLGTNFPTENEEYNIDEMPALTVDSKYEENEMNIIPDVPGM